MLKSVVYNIIYTTRTNTHTPVINVVYLYMVRVYILLGVKYVNCRIILKELGR